MKEYNIYKRCEDFLVDIIKLFETIPYKKSVGTISDQLIRSSGSVGANLHEADNARSKKEFISCVGISLKEVRETIFWLNVLRRTNSDYDYVIQKLGSETGELKKILGSIYQNSRI